MAGNLRSTNILCDMVFLDCRDRWRASWLCRWPVWLCRSSWIYHWIFIVVGSVWISVL